MWHEDLQGHLLVCPARLLVCGIVSEEFEQDVIVAGQNGRWVHAAGANKPPPVMAVTG